MTRTPDVVDSIPAAGRTPAPHTPHRVKSLTLSHPSGVQEAKLAGEPKLVEELAALEATL